MKEYFEFPNSLPVQVSVRTIDEYPIHMHDSMEIIYVLEGEIELKVSFHHYELKKGQLIIVNNHEIHYIRKKSDSNLVLFFNIDKKKYDVENIIFIFDPYFYQYHNQEEIKLVKTYLLEAALHQMTRKRDYEQKVTALIGKCLDVFVKRYQMQFFYAKEMKESMYRDNQVQLDRLQRINDYLYTYFKDKISLDTLAEKEHINKYYLSHLIKYSTGCSFQEIVNIVRTEVSEILLLSTNMAIDDIVHETGFSSYRFFNKHFKGLFHMTPSEYRKKNKNEVLGKKEVKALEYTVKEKVEILENYLNKERNHFDQPKIAVDINACLRKISSPTEMINKEDFKISIPDDQSANGYLKELEGIIDPGQIVDGKSETSRHNFLNDTDFMFCYLIKRLINGACLDKDLSMMDICNTASHFFHGEPGLIAANGIIKSAFYAWYFFFLLGNEIIEKKNNYIITRSPVGIQILFHHDSEKLNEIDKIMEEGRGKTGKEWTGKEWIGLDQSDMTLKLELSNFDENCMIRRYHYHFKHGAYNQFVQMGAPQVISQKDIELINKTSFPEVLFTELQNKGSAYELDITLEPFAAELITIEKIE